MRFCIRIIFLTLKFIFYSSADVNDAEEEEYHKILYKKVVFRPTTSEITNALSDLRSSQDIQVERLQPFFYDGNYSANYIQLLNSYTTLSYKPIKLGSDEITTLTSNYDDGSKKNRIFTQFRLCCKIQEIQCTNYVLLKFILPKVESYLDDIADYVYNMIEMSYRAKFVVSAWLWNLHIKLLGLQFSTIKTQQFLEEHLPEINGTLQKFIVSCRKNKYLMKNCDYTLNHYIGKGNILMLKTCLQVYDEKYKRFFENTNKLPIGVQHLVMISWWKYEDDLFNEINGLAFEWKSTYDLITKDIYIIKNLYYKGKWTIEPFKYIKYHEILLDVLKAKLYSYIWIHLAFYKKAGIIAQRVHKDFIRTLNVVLLFAYVEDQVLNEVLILLSKIYKPNDEKINKTIDLLENEVHVIMSNNTNLNSYKKAEINYESVQLNYNSYSRFLMYHRIDFIQFFRETEEKLGLKLRDLLFYIKGKKTTDIFFPNKWQ